MGVVLELRDPDEQRRRMEDLPGEWPRIHPDMTMAEIARAVSDPPRRFVDGNTRLRDVSLGMPDEPLPLPPIDPEQDRRVREARIRDWIAWMSLPASEADRFIKHLDR